MTRMKRLLFLGAILLVAVAAALTAILLLLPESDLIRSSVQQKLRESTGRDVSLGSLKLSLSFPSVITLTVEGISVPSQRGKSLLSADRLTLVPSLSSLFGEAITIKSMTVQGMRLSVRRSPGGALEDFAQPRPGAGTPEKTEPTAEPAVEPAGSVQPPVPAASVSTQAGNGRIQWKVRTVKIVNSRVDWVDRAAGGGEEAVASLKEINGSVISKGPQESYTLDIRAVLGDDKQKVGTVDIDGVVQPAADFSRLERADVNLRLAVTRLEPFYAYLPSWAQVGEYFTAAKLQSRVSMEAGRPGKVSFKAEMKGDAVGSSPLNVNGTVTTAEDLSSIEEVIASGETDGLPLKVFKSLLPPQLPLDPEKGTVKAGMQGTWQRGSTWKVKGSIGLQNAVLTGRFNSIASQVRVWAQGLLDPDRLQLDNLEIADSKRLATITGTVSQPFSGQPNLDLNGEVDFRSQWLGALGIQLPRNLTVTGVTPVHGKLTGKPANFWIDLTGDVTGTELTASPYLEKAPGAKGSVHIKGRLSTGDDQAAKGMSAEITLGTVLTGVRIRMLKDGPNLAGCTTRLDAKIVYSANRKELRDATLVVRRGSQVPDMLTAKANISDLGAKSPKIDGTVAVAFDKTLLDLADLRLPQGVTVSGNAPLKAKLAGQADDLEWSADLHLTPLDVGVEGTLRKRAGVPGELRASGKWSDGDLSLTEGRFTLPGLLAVGRGMLRDSEGKLRGLTVEVSKAELRELSALVSAPGGLGLSGPLEGRFRIRAADNGVTQNGTVRLLGVDYRPSDAGWSLEKLKGSIETTGSSATISEVSGRIAGTIQAPLKIRGTVNNFANLETSTGRVSVEVGPGRIMLEGIRSVLSHAQVLVGTLLNPQASRGTDDLLDFQSLTGTFDIGSAAVRTENLKLKGSDLSMGAIGAMQLKSGELDALSAFRTVTILPGVIGQIPAVQEAVKKHEDLLKITGLDKELKKLGIGVPDSEQSSEKPAPQPITKTPVTVILKVRGPATRPHMMPVLESALAPVTVNRLKSLIN